jgi:hypothetical protein
MHMTNFSVAIQHMTNCSAVRLYMRKCSVAILYLLWAQLCVPTPYQILQCHTFAASNEYDLQPSHQVPPEQGSTLLSANMTKHSLWGRNCGKTELMHISFCSENITEVLTRINSRGRQIVQKMWKPTRNSRCQNAVTKDIPYWWSSNTRHHYKNLVACVTWYPKIEHTWLLAIPVY